MFPRLNPRWTRFHLLLVLLLAGLAAASPALAGNTHSEGGAVVETPGVPETDGTAQVQIYWTGDSAARSSTTVGAALAGYWLQDVGFALARPWIVGDEHIAVLEFQTGAGTSAHAGFYGVAAKNLTSLDPDEFPSLTVRPIPAPIATAGGGFIDLAWSSAASTTPASVAGYNVYRTSDGVAFTKINAAVVADTTYHDAAVVFGQTYQYALSLAYRGTPQYAGTALSVNSAPATPLDATPPNAPTLAAEPPFTRGLQNIIGWSREAASGATAYEAQCALDEAFASLLGSSGWIADTTYTFTGLADSRIYYYRVRARDAAANASPYSARVSSRQDATPPQSHLLALTGYKASSTVNLEWTAVDSLSGVAGVQLYYAKDGGVYTLYPGGPFTTSPIAFADSLTGGDGQYSFYTLAQDAVANAEGAPETPDATTIIDTQPPAVPALAELQPFTAGAERALSWRNVAATGAVAYRAQASPSATFDAIAFDSGWIADSTYTFTSLADGQRYYYRVRARDQAGNESSFGAGASSTQDASAPETAAQALPAAVNTLALSIAWAGSDATSGLAGVQLYYSKDGAAFAPAPGGPATTSPIAFDAAAAGGDGAYAFYTRGTDAVGNAEAAPAAADAGTRVDTQAPERPTLASLPAYSAGTQLELHWSDASASGAARYLAQAATDEAFTGIVAESGWIAGTSHIFSDLADGQRYFYRVKARDEAGNETAFAASAPSTQDASPPATAAEALPALTGTASLSIAWAGADAMSGLAGADLYYSKDDGSFSLYEGGPFASSPIAFNSALAGGDGEYRFYTRGHDAVGNIEAAPAAPDAETRIDTTPPGAPSIAGLQSFAPGTSVTLGWSDESLGGAVEYQAEMARDAAFAGIEATSGWIAVRSHTFAGLADAERYYFRVKGRDAAKNQTAYSSPQSTMMDATAPQSAAAELPALSGAATLALAWAGADAVSGVHNVDLYYSKDGGPYSLYAGGPFATSPIAFDAATTGGDGHYRFYTRARDGVGNAEEAPATADADTDIDTTAPAVPALAALPTYSAGTSRSLTWSQQSASGAASYMAQAATDPGFAAILASSGWIAGTTHTFGDLVDAQTYYYRVRARDAAGNETVFSAALQSKQDAAAPTSAVAPLPAYSSRTALSLEWNGLDASSGIAAADLYYAKDGAPFALYAGSPFATSPIAFDAALVGGDGDYRFYTRAHDAVGNVEEAPASEDAHTRIDTAAPEAPAIASLPSFLPGTSMTLQWSDRSASGATAYRAQVSAQASFAGLLQTSGWITATQFDCSGLADGTTYYYRVQARDAAANETPFSTVLSATQDATPPASRLAALPGLGSSPVLHLEWSATDMTSGVSGADLYYSRDGGLFTLYPGSPFAASPIDFESASAGGDGQYAFYTRAHDGVGNVEASPASPDAQTRIDTTPPAVPMLTSLPQFSAGALLNAIWSNQSASGALEYKAEMATSPDFASLVAQTGWIAGTSWLFNGLDDGTTYYVRVKARDAAQNETAYAAATSTTMDDTAPASQASALPAAETTTTFAVAWTGSDATSGVASADLYYARENGAYTLYPGGPFASSPIAFNCNATGGEGRYAFYTRARDLVGNREAAPAAADAQTVVSTAPVPVPALAALPAFTSGTSLTLAWAPSSGSVQYQAQAAGDAAFASIQATSAWMTATSYTFNGLGDGQTYYYRLKGRSSLGIESAWSAVLASTQDATPPASQAGALPATIATASFDVAWTASDATSGVANADLFYAREGGPYTPYPGGPYASSPIRFNSAASGGDGRYSFYTRARDGVGNLEAAPAEADAGTSIDTQAPPAPVMLDEPATTPGMTNTVAWSPTADAAEYFAQCAGDAMFLTAVSTSGWITQSSYTFTGLVPGSTYYYRVRARDLSLNASPYSSAVSSMQSPGYALQSGWNLISFNVTPADARIDRVLASIQGSYNIVRTYQGGSFYTYLPTLPLDMNDLTSMDPRQGYWIYMTRPDTLIVSGTPLSAATPIDLATGWGLVGYLPEASMSPSAALGSIQGSYALARAYAPGQGYRTYYPSLPGLSDLTEMRAGRGYWLYMTAADRLIYGGPAAPRAQADPATGDRRLPDPKIKSGTGAAVPTVMDLWSTDVTIDGEPAPAGTILEAYDPAGVLVGQYKLKNPGIMGIMHLNGDVSVTEKDEGALPGEAITIKVRGLDVTMVTRRPIAWQADAVLQVTLTLVDTESLLPKAFSLAANTPNPFNPSTAIAYGIPARVNGEPLGSTDVQLRIYDIRGRVVRTLVNARQKPGAYVVQWDGRDDSGRAAGTGVYFYRLATEQFTNSRKMMLVK